MSQWSSDWGRDERRAYAKGIEKGQKLAYQSERDKTARAALMGILANPTLGLHDNDTQAALAYEIADAMERARTKVQVDDEVPF